MLIQGPGNLLCFAVELGFFLRDHPTPFTTTVATGPATAEYKQHRISTAYVGAVTPLIGVVLSCVWCLSHLGAETDSTSVKLWCVLRGIRWWLLFVEASSRADRDCRSYRLPYGRKLAASFVHY